MQEGSIFDQLIVVMLIQLGWRSQGMSNKRHKGPDSRRGTFNKKSKFLEHLMFEKRQMSREFNSGILYKKRQ